MVAFDSIIIITIQRHHSVKLWASFNIIKWQHSITSN